MKNVLMLEAVAETFKEPIIKARREVKRICAKSGLDIDNPADFGLILRAIDRKHDKRSYKCRYCFDSGMIAWIDPRDGMWYGRKCGRCRYWDEQREKAREQKRMRGVKD